MRVYSIMEKTSTTKLVVGITGPPGIGKSTVLKRVIEALSSRGLKVGGIVCPEVRGEDKRRIGFKIVDVYEGREGWLAVAGEPGTPRIGRYHVRVREAEEVGVKALEYATRNCDVIVIDEIGPMELLSKKLKRTFITAIESGKPVVTVVHHKLRDREILEKITKWFRVTIENRRELSREILEEILKGVASGES